MASVDKGERRSGIELRKLRHWGADVLPICGRQYGQPRHWQVAVRPHGVRDPGHVFLYFMRGTREVPVVSGGRGSPGGSVGGGEEPNGLHARDREVGQTHISEEADEQR